MKPVKPQRRQLWMYSSPPDNLCQQVLKFVRIVVTFNHLTPNEPRRGRTAPLTSKVAFYIFIQQI